MEKLKVLVTDDEMGMRLGVERTLRNFLVRVPDVNEEIGFSVDQAETGEMALEKIEESPPDILLLDHKMPGISGLDVLERLAGRQNELLTIMITAYASIETAVTATKRGAYDFLTKPFTPDELKATVRKAAARIVLAKQTRRLAEEKRQVRFQFIRVLAHELKAPLGVVEGYLEMLADPKTLGDPAALQQCVDRSLVRIEGMRKLIDDLLDLTHIESGQRQRTLVELSVADVARAAIETQEREAAARGITVKLHAEGPVLFRADRREMEMVLNNLVSNAVKYNRDGGRVDVRLDVSNGTLIVAVSDTGIGLAPAEAAQLFGEFVRIRNDKTREILGSGLGLSTVRKIALLYGGEATVESAPDAGSTFRVVLRREV
ncbi:MAG: sensor histidine kinase [Planctomycetota bacterium]